MTLEEKEAAIITHYGVIPQLKYFQSEVFELNEAIITREDKTIELFTYDYRQKLLDNIAEEIADVQLMLNQFKEYYSISNITIDRIMNEKANRQLERIANENNPR